MELKESRTTLARSSKRKPPPSCRRRRHRFTPPRRGPTCAHACTSKLADVQYLVYVILALLHFAAGGQDGVLCRLSCSCVQHAATCYCAAGFAHSVVCMYGAGAPLSNALLWGSMFNDETSVMYKPVPLLGNLTLMAGQVQPGTNYACGLAANGSAWCIGEPGSAHGIRCEVRSARVCTWAAVCCAQLDVPASSTLFPALPTACLLCRQQQRWAAGCGKGCQQLSSAATGGRRGSVFPAGSQ